MQFVERLRAFLAHRRTPRIDKAPTWIRCEPDSRLFFDRCFSRTQNGLLIVGSGSNVEAQIYLERSEAVVSIGARTHMGSNTLITCAKGVSIGDDVLIAFNVLISDHDSHSLDFSERRNDVSDWMKGQKNWEVVPMAPINIASKSWIGAHSILLKGVAIGEGAVVAAGSVVIRDVPPWTLVAGNPARAIRDLKRHEKD